MALPAYFFLLLLTPCNTASTIITAPSTIRPKSIAPKLIRFPDTPNSRIIPSANNIASGITEATTKPPLKLPKKRIRINMTIKAPSARFLTTVEIALSTNFFLSKNGSIVTPSGNVVLICSIFSFTLFITADEFAPFSIITIPVTTSPSALRVAAPYLTLCPNWTDAMSLINTGVPLTLDLTTIFSISFRLLTSPSLLMK